MDARIFYLFVTHWDIGDDYLLHCCWVRSYIFFPDCYGGNFDTRLLPVAYNRPQIEKLPLQGERVKLKNPVKQQKWLESMAALIIWA